MAFEIFAHHAHVFPQYVREIGSVDNLMRTMDACGISKAVCFAPFQHQVGAEHETTSVWLAKEIKNNDRLVGFGVIDFAKGDLKGQVDRIADLGLRGIKMHPASQKFAVDGDMAFEVYARAEELGLFLSFHTGVHFHRLRDYQMWRFDEIAYHFKNLHFSMEHLGGYCDFFEGLSVMINNMPRHGEDPRVFAGLTSIYDRDKNRIWYMPDDRLYDLLWQTGDKASIFGLDFPYNGIEITQTAIKRIMELDLPEESKQLLLGGNLRRVLGL